MREMFMDVPKVRNRRGASMPQIFGSYLFIYENWEHVKLKKKNIEKLFAKDWPKCLFKITKKGGCQKAKKRIETTISKDL
jgi:hypothetical protein